MKANEISAHLKGKRNIGASGKAGFNFLKNTIFVIDGLSPG
ncbi:hypothetical protein HMPREF1986_00636 [Oribacterium sp. oral taxon 078 str. F0263]|nr:hypothetical protein HMPREF1986_00636 [Oribacterium sp. oral taxon 078 str. F0263]